MELENGRGPRYAGARARADAASRTERVKEGSVPSTRSRRLSMKGISMIRKVRPADIDAVIEALRPFNFHVLEPRDGAPLDEDWGGSFVVRNEITVLDLDHGFVAVHEGTVVGFCHYKRLDDETVKTTLLSVPPRYRRHGFGRALQEARMREAYEAGYRRMVTYTENPDAQRWYRDHFGYREAGEEPVLHRIYFFPVEGRVVWGIHYGFKEYPIQKKLECDLGAFFEGRRK
jgi:ribosomal protein S18 acetylase RimI-like enzyme